MPMRSLTPLLRSFPLRDNCLDLSRRVRVAQCNIGVNIGLPVVPFFMQARGFTVVPKCAFVHISSFEMALLSRIGDGV